MSSLLSEALDRGEAGQEVREIVLTGRPGHFSAGFHLETMKSKAASALPTRLP